MLGVYPSCNENSELRALADMIDPDYKRAFDVSQRVLCISPHPDDCEIGAGGAIAKLVARGVEVVLAILTDGSRGGYEPGLSEEEVAFMRRREQEEAARILGVSRLYWIGERDGELKFDRAVLESLVTIVRAVKPDLILAPDPFTHYEAHPDHYYAGRLASASALFSGLPLYGKSDYMRGFKPHSPRFVAYYYTSRPNYILDVSDYLETKVNALKAHRSQFKYSALIDLLLKYMEIVGKKINARFAEEFKVIPISLLHIAPFVEYL